MGFSQEQLAIRLSAKLELPVSVQIDFGSRGRRILARPDVLTAGHGFALCCRCPYPKMAVVELQLDSYGSDIIELWKQRRSQTADTAFDYIESLPFTPSLVLEVNGQRVKSANDLKALALDSWSARNTTLKLVVDKGESQDIEFRAIESATTFVLLLGGYQADSKDGSNSDERDVEGDKRIAATSRYERSWANRMRCLAYHGSCCAICGFDFGKAYGIEYEGMIEVHHIKPLHSLDGPVHVDPIKDMVPLCPNCHAAVHRTDPPIDPCELKAIYMKRNRAL